MRFLYFLKRYFYIWNLGEGQFGKVYSAVNLDTGELMAVKQVTRDFYKKPWDCVNMHGFVH